MMMRDLVGYSFQVRTQTSRVSQACWMDKLSSERDSWKGDGGSPRLSQAAEGSGLSISVSKVLGTLFCVSGMGELVFFEGDSSIGVLEWAVSFFISDMILLTTF